MTGNSITRLWYDLRFRRRLIQLIALVVLVLGVLFIIDNTQTNLQRLNIQPGFAS